MLPNWESEKNKTKQTQPSPFFMRNERRKTKRGERCGAGGGKEKKNHGNERDLEYQKKSVGATRGGE